MLKLKEEIKRLLWHRQWLVGVTCTRKAEASLPEAPYQSTGRGVENHTRAKHLSSLAMCHPTGTSSTKDNWMPCKKSASKLSPPKFGCSIVNS